ncbi:MAG: DMP19 family protein [Bacteroidales bacterium]|nr:DMP19 family protein [Bacteroidales bacterium]MDD4823346.1 DMP19 family protein [Bacteroidales bacterium]
MDELLPIIKGEQLSAAAEQGMDEFIAVFTNAYLEMIQDNLTSESMQQLNGHQNTLLAYHYFVQEIQSGGFVQLIQNGYGPYIFDNPFAKAMRLFGAKELSKLIYKAKKIYDEHRERLERETTEDEFMAMYEEFEAFDDLEEEYFELEEEATAAIAHYIDEHLDLFATIKE